MQPDSFVVTCPNPEGIEGTHDVTVHQWGSPSNEKVLCCVHGLTRNGRDFDFLVQPLLEDYRILCPDIVGRGQSDWLKNAEHYNYITYVSDMLHIMQQLEIAHIDWIGTSMGGLIGMMIAANVPGAISRLVMNDIGPFIPKHALERLGQYVGNAPVFDDQESAKDYFKTIWASWGIEDESHFDHMFAHSINNHEGKWVVSYDPAIGAAFKDEDDKTKLMEDVDLWYVWEKVNCPVLLLRGGNSDILPAHVASSLAKQAHVNVVEFESIGHAPTLMSNNQINSIVNWLRT